MSNITINEVPDELRNLLEASAARHFRSVAQEALARITLSFELEKAMAEQKWIDDALKGELRPITLDDLKILASRIKASRTDVK